MEYELKEPYYSCSVVSSKDFSTMCEILEKIFTIRDARRIAELLYNVDNKIFNETVCKNEQKYLLSSQSFRAGM